MGGSVDRLGGWRAERASDGTWVAAKTVTDGRFGTTAKIRRRRALGVPSSWRLAEVESYMAGMVANGKLD